MNPYVLSILFATSLLFVGCASNHARGPYQPGDETNRDTARATKLNEQAMPYMDKGDVASLAQAEKLLRESLTADLFYGPAHNNLGVVLLSRGELFGAAQEFEWGRKLMPGHPDPRINLALTLETAGRNSDAMDAYLTAIEVYPDHIAAIQGLARLSIKSGKRDERTPGWLRDIAMRGETQQWREWARSELSRTP
ncbi:MAG: tetratricopeptide repeat protein [Phycisphaerales bacterium]